MIKDIKGQKFGRLTVIEFVEVRKRKSYWKCRCDCGNEKIVAENNLQHGGVQSCGCLRKDNAVKHRESKTRLYCIWAGMRQRCNNPKSKDYAKYGGRGITICEEWNEFLSFKSWAAENGYDETKSIDRINNDLDYCPTNCRWADSTTQENNKRNNHYLTINGETKTISEWAKESGVSADRIRKRINKGWPVELAVFQPIDLSHKHN